jgi:hypothetical protein
MILSLQTFFVKVTDKKTGKIIVPNFFGNNRVIKLAMNYTIWFADITRARKEFVTFITNV